MREQGDTFYLRDFHPVAHVDELSCRRTSERSCLELPGIDGYALALRRLRPDAQRPAVDLSVSGGELSPSDVNSDAKVAAAFLMSVKSYGAPPYSIFPYLIRRLPVRPCTEAPMWAGCEPEEISL